jgi:hypothetical protein
MLAVANAHESAIYGGMDFFQKVELLLALRGMKQKELAKAAGLSESQVSDWKTYYYGLRKLKEAFEAGVPEPDEGSKGKRAPRSGGPSLKQGVLIARVLGVTPEYLALDEIEEPDVGLTADEEALIRVYRAVEPDPKLALRAIAKLASRFAEEHEKAGSPPTPVRHQVRDDVPRPREHPPANPGKTRGSAS